MLQERFEFRTIDPDNKQEVDHTIYMEAVCMPPGEGCTREEILDRVYAEREKAKGRKRMVLTCVEKNIKMYKKFGYRLLGLSQSVYGGAVCYDMDIIL